MDLGAFSVSLAVKDLGASRAFSEKLGFEVTGGDVAYNYLILVNGRAVIGLFQGMFEKNILTFNPGWLGPHELAEDGYPDVRAIAAHLEAQGLALATKELPGDSGPGNVVLTDPDGNPILIDQHR